MSWKRLGGLPALLLILALIGGCKQRAFMTEADFNRTQTTILEGLELKPDVVAQPLTNPVAAPPTLNNLDRKIRFISLAECISIALESGRVGQPSLLFPGTALDNLVQFTGRGASGSDAIRVFAIDPARLGAEMEASLTKFDAVFTGSLTWNTTDQPVGTPLQTFQAQNINAIQTQDATASLGVIKPLATGGVAGITFNVPYTNTNIPTTRVNPSYRPQLQFQFEQPLLQGFGVEINQLRATHPGSLLNAGVLNTSPTAEGILITRLRYDQQRAEFERVLNQMLLNVEVAYWNLYGAYWTLYSREQGLRFAFEAFKLNKLRYEAGKATAADFYQSRGQYELFRAQRLTAIDDILEKERQLRALIGINVEDGTRLMPSDSPTLAPYQPNWDRAWEDAVTKRPELYMARQDVKATQLRLVLAKNSLLPDLRFTATYDVNGLGTRLDGATGTGTRDVNAFRSLSENDFNNWSAGLRMNIPIGYRFAHTQVRQAQLDLARAMEVLKDQELKAVSFLYSYYKRLSLNYEQIRANRAQREAFGEQLRVRQQEYLAGRGTLDILLEAQRFWAEALASEYSAIRDYNNALVGFEFAKGTIQQHDNVHIAEGSIPECAAARAVDHYRQRTAAFVLRERAMPTAITPVACTPGMEGKAVSLPAVMAAVPPLKDVPVLPGTPDMLPNKLTSPVEAKPEELFIQPKPVETPSKEMPMGTLPKSGIGATVPTPAPVPTATPAPVQQPEVKANQSSEATEKPTGAESNLPELFAPGNPAVTLPSKPISTRSKPSKPKVRKPSDFGTARDPD